MSERIILSEKLEDNKAAVEWGIKQADLIKKGEEITQRLIKKYTPIILSRNIQETNIWGSVYERNNSMHYDRRALPW